jgi:DNA mismatch endonuclease (patch repair protein)
MRSIRSTDTKPELTVRRLLWSLGARYRLHARELPGRPDIVMRRRKIAILVHGCFWHLHEGCPLARVPRSQPDYWPTKLRKNKERDQANLATLTAMGWTVLVVWECETAYTEKLCRELRNLLDASAKPGATYQQRHVTGPR